MSYIKKLSTVSTTVGLGALLAVGLSGCENRSEQNTRSESYTQKQPAFVIIEETKPGRYKIAEEFPAKETRIVLKKLDGTEKVMTKEELDYLIKKEAAKIENGTSNLINPQGAEAVSSQGGMGIGEAILASAAGAVLGSWIGSKLFSNPNYQQARRTGYKNPSTYNRSVKSFGKSSSLKKSSSKSGRSGFFGGRSGSSGRSGFYGG